MWGWDRFGNPAIVQQALAAPTVLTDLGKSVVLKGDLFASEDLTIEGRVEGTITVQGHTLTVGHHAHRFGNPAIRSWKIGGPQGAQMQGHTLTVGHHAQILPGLRQSEVRFTAM